MPGRIIISAVLLFAVFMSVSSFAAINEITITGNQTSGPVNAVAPGDVEVNGSLSITAPGGLLYFPDSTFQGTAAVFPSCNTGEVLIKTSTGWGCVTIGISALPNATGLCVGSSCSVACAPGFGNCDSSAANGCEINLNASADNCGACGTVCQAVANGTPGCSNGLCVVANCNVPFANCNQIYEDGCEINTANNPQHCSGCGMSCPSVTNGNPLCSNSTCSFTCNGGYLKCGNSCVNLSSDVSNCGVCGYACQGVPNGTPACANGVCSFNCTGGYTKCGNSCFNLSSDVSNCGACGNACPAVANGTPTCTGSVCSFTCNGGYTKCGNSCRNTLTDVANCGACGNVCPAVANGTPVCTNGACSFTCNGGYTKCGNSCFNTATDTANCGACGMTCPAVANGTPGCANSSCTVASCNAGFANCDNILGTGCEINTFTNSQHCGACGSVCSLPNATSACSAGVCTIASCNAGFADCNGLPADGCETDYLWDTNNCGGCGNYCNGICDNGGCY